MLALLAATAAAPAPPPVNPMRCLLMASIVLQNPDPKIAEIGKMASAYWMGRVNGSTPNANLTQQLAAQVKTMQGAAAGAGLQADAQRCDAEMKLRGAQMKAAGQALQAQSGQPAK